MNWPCLRVTLHSSSPLVSCDKAVQKLINLSVTYTHTNIDEWGDFWVLSVTLLLTKARTDREDTNKFKQHYFLDKTSSLLLMVIDWYNEGYLCCFCFDRSLIGWRWTIIINAPLDVTVSQCQLTLSKRTSWQPLFTSFKTVNGGIVF